MTDETLDMRINEWNAETNTVEMGIPIAAEDTAQCIDGLIHETGHMWLQANNEAVNYNFGQWITEASTNIVERILSAEGIRPASASYCFDILDYTGWEHVNGVIVDGEKHCRRLANLSGGTALYYLDTVLSSPGTFDYLVKVNSLLTEYAKTQSTQISAAVYASILEEASSGKTIDGMSPSQWLFSRPASNTTGSDGTYMYVFPNMGEYYIDGRYLAGHDLRVNLMGWTRTDGKETSLAGEKVCVSLYDCNGTLKGSNELTFENDGSIEKADVGGNDLPAYSAIRYVASMQTGGKTYTDTNFSLVLPRDEYITADDDRMFFILIDENENIVTNLATSEISVTGAESVDTSHIASGLLIVRAVQGSHVTVNSPAGSRTISKPLGSRIVPITVNDTSVE